MTVTAIARFVKLLQDCDNEIKVVSSLTDEYAFRYDTVTLNFDKNFVNRYTGIEISNEEILKTLSNLGFKAELENDEFTVVVPSWRATKDVTIKADIIEDITSIYGYDIFQIATREFTVVVILVILLNIEIYRAVGFIGITCIENALNEIYLLHDVPRSVWLDRWSQDIELLHSFVVTLGIVVRHLHRLQLLKASLLCDLILSLIGIMLQMAYIGNVANIAHLISQMGEVTVQNIESNCRTGVSQMCVTVNSRAADIKSNVSFVNRFEYFFFP